MKKQVLDKLFVPYLSKADINTAIEKMAATINADYDGKKPLFIAILNGSFMFASDLLKKIDIPVEISFIKLASYKGTKSSGSVVTAIGLESDVFERDVIIIEDILDTGVTMDKIVSLLQSEQPASVAICTLLIKPHSYRGKHQPQFVGFEIDDRFVVGYGLDYKERGRELSAIYQLIQ